LKEGCDSDHDRHAFVDAVDGVVDERFAFFEAEIGVFLGLDPGRDHHGGAAVPHHIVDLAPQRGLIDIEVGGKGSEWRNDQSRLFHVPHPPVRAFSLVLDKRSARSVCSPSHPNSGLPEVGHF
jgi:hypothetical protein